LTAQRRPWLAEISQSCNQASGALRSKLFPFALRDPQARKLLS
jgi:hypothetical protein